MPYGYAEKKEALVRRLHRIEGQVRGIERMVEDDRYCIDILTQISAVTTALESLGLEILDDHVSPLRRRRTRLRRARRGGGEDDRAPRRRPPLHAQPVIADVGSQILDALSFSFGMFWEILWALILGFALSGVVQAVVSKREMRRLLPDDSARTLAVATGLGAASSSCSYAAVALARSLFRRGADFTAAIAFEIASTNLVFELGIVIALLLGWEFVLGEFVGGPLMIVLVAVGFRIFLQRRLVDAARKQANRGLVGSMEGHAEMDMSAGGEGSWWRRLRTARGFTATADYFVMDWVAIWRDIAIGLLVAGALAAWVPDSWWQSLFLVDHPTAAKIWGPVIGPLVAVISFVCSVGNVPLAAVLWNGGISFGGVIAFIFGDLIIAPILNIYRKYYGLGWPRFWRPSCT